MKLLQKFLVVLILTTLGIVTMIPKLQSEPTWPTERIDTAQNYSAPSLRPFERYLVSSRFGERDIEKGGVIVHEFHSGVDYRAQAGTPVKAAGSGQVILARAEKGYGFYYIIYHGVVSGNEVISVYAHLSEPMVLKNSFVNEGDVIGLVGDSGNAEGPHLHFEVRVRKVGRKIYQPIYPGYYYKA